MRRPSSRRLAAGMVLVLLLPGLAAAQRRARGPVEVPEAPEGWTLPRTVDGHPDLRGVWVEIGGTRGGARLSDLVIDPPEGGIPALTEQAQKDWDELQQYLEEHPADTWKDRSLGERCVTLGVPVRANFNQYYKFVQNRDHVVIVMEWYHEARVIPSTVRPTPIAGSGFGSAILGAAGKATPWSSRPRTTCPRATPAPTSEGLRRRGSTPSTRKSWS